VLSVGDGAGAGGGSATYACPGTANWYRWMRLELSMRIFSKIRTSQTLDRKL